MGWGASILCLVTLFGAPPAAPLHCPEGLKVIGDPPPAGHQQWCGYRAADGRLVFHGRFVQWFDEGVVKTEGTYARGLRTGRWVEYDVDGQRIGESTYVADMLDGPYLGVVDGQRVEGQYRAGRREGAWRHYDLLGNKTSEGVFKSDRREGRWTLYLEDGYRAEGSFVADKREGRWVIFGPRGARRAEGQVVHGVRQGSWTEYDDEGRLLAKGRYVDDKRDGGWAIFYPDGSKQAEGAFVADLKSGRWVENDVEGDRWEGSYEEGKRQGTWTRYRRESGLPAERGAMRDDEREGQWSFFDERGALVAKGPYADDRRHGVWTELSPDGSYVEGEYRDGEREGLWVAYGADGAARLEMRYAKGLRVDESSPTAGGISMP